MDNIRNIEWQTYGETVISPIALSFTLLMGLLILFLKREYVIIPIIAVACFITNMQRIVIANLDFDMLRIIIIFGLIRVLLRSEFRLKSFNIIDKLIIIWVIVRIITHTILWGTTGALVYGLGSGYVAIGLYFLFRFLIRDIEDIKVVFKALIILSIPIAIAMINEQITHQNIFYIFGGVEKYSAFRVGRFRSQGAFSHPILAGSFGASLLPLAVGLWGQKTKQNRRVAFLGIITSPVITIASASSGPFMAFIAGILWLVLWIFRQHMRVLLIGSFVLMIGLQLYMDNPIWHAILRVSVVSGSTSYHRFLLIDQSIRRLNEWWLVGVKSTAHWGWGLNDVTNRYVREGVDGGILPLLLFILIIILNFQTLAIAVQKLGNNNDSKLYWGLAASYFTHAISFIGVSYFGQMMFFWYLPTAIISSIRSQVLINKEEIDESHQ
jgi:hypothetical protein